MAFVGLSRKTLDEIAHNINRMADKERQATTPEARSDTIELQGGEQWVQELVWGRHLALKSQMPKEWYGQLDRINVDVGISVEDSSGNVVSKTVRIVVHQSRGYFDGPPKLGYNPVFKATEASLPHLQPAIEYHQSMYAIDHRWQKVREQVMGFLDKCKSLNEAYKLWPQIDMYLSPWMVNKLNEKVERTKSASEAAEALKSLDTDQLTSAAVIARMAGN